MGKTPARRSLDPAMEAGLQQGAGCWIFSPSARTPPGQALAFSRLGDGLTQGFHLLWGSTDPLTKLCPVLA